MTALVPGAMLGSYTIGQELGRGAMGSVFEGVHRVTGVRRAIKVVRADLAASSEYRERFVREASIATQLRHPNIVETYDPIVDGSLLALPMEFLHGRPLSAYFQERTRLELREIVSLVLPVGAALAAIHARGYVHRDVKPHNVMLVESAGGLEPKLLDFGTARDVLGLQRTTLTGEIVGSPAYMAPEQALGLRDIDARADVYAFGVTLYHALTGQRPLVTDAEGSVLEKLIRRARPKRPREIVSSIAPEIEAVVMHAIAWERAERFQGMPALLAAFDAAWRAAEESVLERVVGAAAPQTIPMGRVETPEASRERSMVSVATVQGAAFVRGDVGLASAMATTVPASVQPSHSTGRRASLHAERLPAVPTGLRMLAQASPPAMTERDARDDVPPSPVLASSLRAPAFVAGVLIVGVALVGLTFVAATLLHARSSWPPPRISPPPSSPPPSSPSPSSPPPSSPPAAPPAPPAVTHEGQNADDPEVVRNVQAESEGSSNRSERSVAPREETHQHGSRGGVETPVADDPFRIQ